MMVKVRKRRQAFPSSWCTWMVAFVCCCSVQVARVSPAPIPAPDFETCEDDPTIPKCCPPVPPNGSGSSKRFVNPTASSLPLRTRMAAHQLDSATVAKLNRAYKLMRALPSTDPRSLEQQRRMHCAYCCALFPQAWDVDYSGDTIPAALQIHFGWLLFPWHRWFLYFHERILASLVGDNTLALPFWNWSNQAQSQSQSPAAMPAAYQTPGSGLYDAKRSPAHQPPAIANLTFNAGKRPTKAQINTPQLVQENLNLMHQIMVSAPTTRAIFFGQPYRLGAQLLPGAGPGQGIVESTVHNSIHDWTGNEKNSDYEDMGAFFVSGIDPIFYAHHGEIDRLWNVWKSLGGKDLDDPDYLNTEFLFYDETAQLVKVTVGQGLDSVNQLRYTYQSVTADANWLNHAATSCASAAGADSSAKLLQSVPMYKKKTVSINTAAPFTARFQRPDPEFTQQLSDDGQQGGASAEVLIFDGLKVNWKQSAQFKVFVNLPSASAATSVACAEFLGIFSNIANNAPADSDKISFRLGIGNKLKQLGAESSLAVVVTVVPGVQHTSASPIVIDKIRVALEQV